MKRFIDLSFPPSIGSCESIHEARGVLWNLRTLQIYPFRQRMRAVTRITRAFRCAWVKWVNLERERLACFQSTPLHEAQFLASENIYLNI